MNNSLPRELRVLLMESLAAYFLYVLGYFHHFLFHELAEIIELTILPAVLWLVLVVLEAREAHFERDRLWEERRRLQQ